LRQLPCRELFGALIKTLKLKKVNINLAKKLLKEAGFENGFEISLWTLPVSRPYNLNGKKWVS